MTHAHEEILLDAYSAIRCPVKVQNRYHPLIERPDPAVDTHTADAQVADFFGGQRFIESVLDAFASLPGVVDLRGMTGDPAAWEHATREAVRARAEVVVAPRLPADHVGHRRGSPRVLIRGNNRPDGRPGYYPIQVRAKKALERSNHFSGAHASLISAPQLTSALPIINGRLRDSREEDLIHMAHFWRMLEACGWASAGEPIVGMVGNLLASSTEEADDLGRPQQWIRLAGKDEVGREPVIAWMNLRLKQIRTYAMSAAQGWKNRSGLDRYDHEHDFRVKVAIVARRSTDGPNDPALMVAPIVTPECQTCPWWPVCKPMLDQDDLSLQICKARLDVREISVLRSMGISSVEDLANTDLEDFLPTYLPRVGHLANPEDRLRLAARRARLIASGQELERINPAPIILPDADPEIDWDIETSADNRVYLWGFWIRDTGSAKEGRYVSFARFEELDDEGEYALAAEAVAWLVEILEAHPQARVYHYSDYEMVHLAKLARASDDPVLLRGLAVVGPRAVDLFAIMRKHFFGVHGLGLKIVATGVCGFSWRDEDPGGLNSQMWFHDAVHANSQIERHEAAKRVLEYNEDDVKATVALRAWLREQK